MPPLAPAEFAERAAGLLSDLQNGVHSTAQEVERRVVEALTPLYPYIRAFSELYAEYRVMLGMKLLRQKAPVSLRRAITALREQGFDFEDFFSGRASRHIAHEAHAEFHALIIDLSVQVREFARHQALHGRRRDYERRVSELEKDTAELTRTLEHIQEKARVLEHEGLAREFAAYCEGVFHGLSFLGPNIPPHDAVQMREYCTEREKDFTRRLNLSSFSPS